MSTTCDAVMTRDTVIAVLQRPRQDLSSQVSPYGAQILANRLRNLLFWKAYLLTAI